MSDPIETALEDELARLQPDLRGRLWIAFSGGLDSTVLLHQASRLDLQPRPAAVHINHGLQQQADAWAAHCQSQCDRLGMELIQESVNLPSGGNIENHGRRARIAVFENTVRDADVIATAHHLDDVAESVLWQVATGRAKVGIASLRELRRGRLWRPFLAFDRTSLTEYATRHRLDWVVDPSNDDTSFTRMYLRHRVLAPWRERYPSISQELVRLVEHVPTIIQKGPLSVRDHDLDHRLVRAWLLTHGETPKSTVIDEIVRQASSAPHRMPMIEIGNGLTVRCYRAWLHVVKKLDSIESNVLTVGQTWVHGAGVLTWERQHGGFAAGDEVTVRGRTRGERVRVRGHRRPLSKVFQEHGVPPWQRDSWPLVTMDDEVMCVPELVAPTTRNTNAGLVPRWQPNTV